MLRHHIIKSHIERQSGPVANDAVRLWAQLATQIVAIVGEGGFNSLYTRSIFLAQSRFPWLAVSAQLPMADHRFAELNIQLQEQPPDQAREANVFLLITFTDILTSLIGEQLTMTILSSAWGHENVNVVDQEFEND